MKIGYDVGGVISPTHNDRHNLTDEQPQPHHYIVAEMNNHVKTGNELFIISFCGPKRVASTISYLTKHNIVPDLVALANVYFIGSDKNAKVGLCNHLQLDQFTDDKMSIIDVLNKGSIHIGNKKRKRWSNAGGTTANRPDEWVKWKTVIPDWDTLLDRKFTGRAIHYS
jgi:hypothetical protein